ncbi:hypothetical protein [Ferroacidibacillus organovorans]|uniref:Uncharacterized protein n=1 Tax=Ferroacidibacillus organovorans TaxID=1765683 RepID=A0A853KEK3_9BACL|nr:hypothetical protein [Ferroacidibacillus organovorans]KYP79636.1 hypothetical protein AYJ22_03495 [Ferroacidibacillus organovorans]OAG94851.1 hypothetical protein AYW79_03600 [Ferroacidibacillus organovorans]
MRFLLKLYPQAWRERYEEEMLAVLMEHKITPATVVDLLIGAFDAHLNDNGFAKGARFMRNQLRSGLVMTFCAFMVFGVGWGALQRITDPLPLFQAVNKLYPELGILHDTVFIVGCFAFLAFLISGLPIFFISIKRAFENKLSSQKADLFQQNKFYSE